VWTSAPTSIRTRLARDRVRAHNVFQSLILLGQGIPFLHAGSEILRSKSAIGTPTIRATGSTSSTGRCPAPSGRRACRGLRQQERVAAPREQVPDGAAAGQRCQQRAFDHVREMLRIRKSSTLFRLRDAEQVNLRVKFYNTGPSQLPGVIAMGIDGCTNPGEPAPDKGAYMVVFNASDDPRPWRCSRARAGRCTRCWPLDRCGGEDRQARCERVLCPGAHHRGVRTGRAEILRAVPVDMYVRGSFNDWANRRRRVQAQLPGRQGLLGLGPVTFPANFKIASADWSAVPYDCGASVSGAPVLLASRSR